MTTQNIQNTQIAQETTTRKPLPLFYERDFTFYLSEDLSQFKRICHRDICAAFVHGFKYALGKTHTFSNYLFMLEDELASEIYAFLQDEPSPKFLRETGQFLWTAINSLSCPWYGDFEPMGKPEDFLSDTFLNGYQVGLFMSGKYDRCLFLTGHQLHVQVLADLHAYTEKEQDAQHAAARIVMDHYGTSGNKELLAALEASSKANDSDNPFAAKYLWVPQLP